MLQDAFDMRITAICQAADYFAGYCGETPRDDKLLPVICWASISDGDGPDEVMGQIWDGSCITEAPSAFSPEDEEGEEEDPEFVFVGYFRSDDGTAGFQSACNEIREQDDE